MTNNVPISRRLPSVSSQFVYGTGPAEANPNRHTTEKICWSIFKVSLLL